MDEGGGERCETQNVTGEDDHVIDHKGSKVKNCCWEDELCGFRVSSLISLADPEGRPY